MAKYISKKNKRKLKRKKRIITLIVILIPITILVMINKQKIYATFSQLSKSNNELEAVSETLENEVETEKVEISDVKISVFKPDNNVAWREKVISKKEDIDKLIALINSEPLGEEVPPVLYETGIVVEYKEVTTKKIIIFQEKILKEKKYYKTNSNLYNSVLELYNNSTDEEVIF